MNDRSSLKIIFWIKCFVFSILFGEILDDSDTEKEKVMKLVAKCSCFLLCIMAHCVRKLLFSIQVQ